MPDEETNETLMMSLSIEWRDEGPEPTAIMSVPLGGPEPVVIIGLDFVPPNIAEVKVSVSGFPNQEALSDLFRALADHMETVPATVISADGVEYREPLNKGETT